MPRKSSNTGWFRPTPRISDNPFGWVFGFRERLNILTKARDYHDSKSLKVIRDVMLPLKGPGHVANRQKDKFLKSCETGIPDSWDNSESIPARILVESWEGEFHELITRRKNISWAVSTFSVLNHHKHHDNHQERFVGDTCYLQLLATRKGDNPKIITGYHHPNQTTQINRLAKLLSLKRPHLV